MPFIAATDATLFSLPGVTFTALAAPSRGANETAAWRLRMAPHTSPHPHRLTREEVFIVLSGQAQAQVGDARHTLGAGCALVVPPNTAFALSNPYDEAFEAIAMLPVGGRAIIGDEAPFVPPWAQ